MDKIKKIFYEQNLTWLKVIVFSVVCGIITGIIPLIKVLDNTSIHNIAECYEMWVLLALLIILNSKKPLEAGLKTFVFFLISQPLCYLVQVPFYRDGFGIFMYYSFWAKLTLLTFPGAIIAWYTKKENWLSVLIFSVALCLLGFELFGHFSSLITSFPYQLLAVLFILFEIIIFTNIIFNDKRKRIVLYIISFIFFVCSFFYNLHINKINNNLLQNAAYVLDENNEYSVIYKNENVDVKFSNNLLVATPTKTGEYIIKIKDKDGNIISFSLVVTEKDSDIKIINNAE